MAVFVSFESYQTNYKTFRRVCLRDIYSLFGPPYDLPFTLRRDSFIVSSRIQSMKFPPFQRFSSKLDRVKYRPGGLWRRRPPGDHDRFTDRWLQPSTSFRLIFSSKLPLLVSSSSEITSLLRWLERSVVVSPSLSLSREN